VFGLLDVIQSHNQQSREEDEREDEPPCPDKHQKKTEYGCCRHHHQSGIAREIFEIGHLVFHCFKLVTIHSHWI
jgi:hypothetical protein